MIFLETIHMTVTFKAYAIEKGDKTGGPVILCHIIRGAGI